MIKELNLSQKDEIKRLRSKILSEAYDILMRLMTLTIPPYIVQENKEYPVVEYNNKYYISMVNTESMVNKEFSQNTLFFLKDGYAIEFDNDLNLDNCKIYVFGSCVNDDIMQKICNYLNLSLLNKYDIFHTSYFDAEYSFDGDVDYSKDIILNIDKLYLNSCFKLKNSYKRKVKLNVKDVYVLSCNGTISSDFCANVDNLHFGPLKYINYNFSEYRNVKSFDLSEGTEVLCLSGITKTSIEELSFPSTIKYIGSESFRCANYLKTVDTSKMDDYILGRLCFSRTNFKSINLERCSVIGSSCFSNSSLSKCRLNLNTIINVESFVNSELSEVEFFKSDIKFKNINMEDYSSYDIKYQTLKDKEIIDDYWKDLIISDDCHETLSYYDEGDDTYSLGISSFKNCYNLMNINLPVNKVILRNKCVYGCAPGLKLTGVKEIDIYDEKVTLFSSIPISITDCVELYFEKLENKNKDEFKDLIYLLYSNLYDDEATIYMNSRYYYTGYSDYDIEGNMYELSFMDIYVRVVESICDYIDIQLSMLCNSSSRFEGCIPVINYSVIGKKVERELDIKKYIDYLVKQLLCGGINKDEEYEKIISNRMLSTFNTYRL